MSMIHLPDYEDRAGLWGGELQPWMPGRIFDAHVHLGPPEAVPPLAPERDILLTLWTALEWQEALAGYGRLFGGKAMAGVIAFPFPIREADIQVSNRYIARLMAEDKRVKGFMLVHPARMEEARREFYAHAEKGVRFLGLKPYYDLLGKSAAETSMSELVPESMLEFMRREHLMLMIHPCGIGVGDPAVGGHVRLMAEKYPEVKVILAHFGRHTHPDQFLRFMDSGLMDYPSLYLEMSAVTSPAAHKRAIAERALWPRIMFGSDMPWAMLEGRELYDERGSGCVLLTRHEYRWSDKDMLARHAAARESLTYKIYYVLKSLKDAIEGPAVKPAERQKLKEDILCNNALRLFGE